MGQNGAGKSTLIKVLTGVYPRRRRRAPRWTAQPIRPASPLDGAAAGHQHGLPGGESLPEPLGGGEHLRRPLSAPRRGAGLWRIDWARMHAQARALLARLNLDIDVTRLLSSYPVAVQQMVAIARALSVAGQGADPRRADLEPRRAGGRAACSRCCASCAARAWRSCSSPTSSTRCTRSPIASRCCATASCVGEWPTRRAAAAGADHRDGRARARGAAAGARAAAADRRPRAGAAARRAASASAGSCIRSTCGCARRGRRPRRPARLGPHRAGAAAVRPGPQPTAASCASTASAVRFDTPGARDPPRPGACARRSARPTASSPSCRCARTSCWRCRRGCGVWHVLSRARQQASSPSASSQRSASRRADIDTPIAPALGRQPAEGGARALARDRPAPADPRRADARHRRRGQAGDHERDPARWRAAAWRCCSSRRRWTRWCASRDRIVVLRDRRKVGELPGSSSEQAVYDLIAAGT